MLIIQSVFLAASILLLWFGADWLVSAAARIAKRFGVSEMVIGLTVVAAGTSAPEFAVTIDAAISGQPEIALANIIGSNIFNLGLILGMVVLASSVLTSQAMVYRDGIMLMTSCFIALFCVLDGVLTRIEGVLLVSILIGYLVFLYRQRVDTCEDLPEGDYRLTDWFRLLMGLGMVLGGGQLLVDSASYLALFFGLSEWLIGLTVVAVGTSAPELVTSLAALMRGNHGISVGNLIGSDLFNVLGAIGLAAIARPLVVGSGAFNGLVLMTGMAIVITIMMRSNWRLSRTEGGLLFSMGLARWALNLFFV